MNYKMIVVDLDDSLLGNDLKISEANKRALLAARDEGLYVTIATGRMYNSALPFIKELGIDIPVMTYQGAYIKDPNTGDTLVKSTISIDDAREIINECDRDNLYIQAYVEDEYYFSKASEYSELYQKLAGVRGTEVGDLAAFLKDEPIKLLAIDQPDRITELRRKYGEIFGNQVNIAISKPIYIEFTNIEATKGKALEHLASILGVKRDEIIAIGDSYNDLSMIQYAGMGVAMGNAPEDIKAHARYVTRGNDEDGVADAIDRLVFKKGVLK